MIQTNYIEELEFFNEGNCLGLGHDAFYLERGQSTPLEVKEMCATCPVLDECREYAIKHEVFGFWGGLSEKQRELERRRRRINVDCPNSYWNIELSRKSHSPSNYSTSEKKYVKYSVCGTTEGFNTHKKRKTKICDECLEAYEGEMVS